MKDPGAHLIALQSAWPRDNVDVDVAMLGVLGELDHVGLLAPDELVKRSGYISNKRSKGCCLFVGQISDGGDVSADDEDGSPREARVVAMHDVPGVGSDDAVPAGRLASIASRE